MKRLSFEPDPWMAWIYNKSHPDYNSPRAEALRMARSRALAQCSEWMRWEAKMNDAEDKAREQQS